MRVLVVEDEVRLAAAIASGLSAEGYEVDVAHDGLTGVWVGGAHYDKACADLANGRTSTFLRQHLS